MKIDEFQIKGFIARIQGFGLTYKPVARQILHFVYCACYSIFKPDQQMPKLMDHSIISLLHMFR
jgi:hypothetical protein